MDVQELADLSDETFAEVIARCTHMRTTDPDEWAALTGPELIERTRDALALMYRRVSTQIRNAKSRREVFRQECFERGDEGKKAWFESMSEYEQWRNRAGNFQAAVQTRLSETRKILKNLNRANNASNHDRSRNALRTLALAVRRHQAAHAKAGGIAEQCDYELWKHLDQITVEADDQEMPLRTMLDVYWYEVAPVTSAEQATRSAEVLMKAAPAGQSSRFSGTPRARHVDNDRSLT
jgi:hypothetical protein